MRGAAYQHCHTCFDPSVICSTMRRDGLQLLADCSRSFCRSTGLNSNDFDQVRDAAHVIRFMLPASQSGDLNGDGGVRFALQDGK